MAELSAERRAELHRLLARMEAGEEPYGEDLRVPGLARDFHQAEVQIEDSLDGDRRKIDALIIRGFLWEQERKATEARCAALEASLDALVDGLLDDADAREPVDPAHPPDCGCHLCRAADRAGR